MNNLSLFYRRYINDYVINPHGNFEYDPRYCHTFKTPKEVESYLKRNYSSSKEVSILVENSINGERYCDLEKALRGTRIKLERKARN